MDKQYTIDQENVFSRTLENETIILNLKTGQYFSTDTVGSRIWDLLVANNPLPEIIDILATEFDCAHEELSHDLTEFISELKQKSLIVEA